MLRVTTASAAASTCAFLLTVSFLVKNTKQLFMKGHWNAWSGGPQEHVSQPRSTHPASYVQHSFTNICTRHESACISNTDVQERSLHTRHGMSGVGRCEFLLCTFQCPFTNVWIGLLCGESLITYVMALGTQGTFFKSWGNVYKGNISAHFRDVWHLLSSAPFKLRTLSNLCWNILEKHGGCSLGKPITEHSVGWCCHKDSVPNVTKSRNQYILGPESEFKPSPQC